MIEHNSTKLTDDIDIDLDLEIKVPNLEKNNSSVNTRTNNTLFIQLIIYINQDLNKLKYYLYYIFIFYN